MNATFANLRSPEIWKADSWCSVEFYNNWFMSFAPEAFRKARSGVLANVSEAFRITKDLTDITSHNIISNPSVLAVLRMTTAPPLAQDRLAGLSYISRNILKTLECGKLPKKISHEDMHSILEKVLTVIIAMIDRELFPWMNGRHITSQLRNRSAAIIADRLTGVLSDPIIRNEQEIRQLKSISHFLEENGYSYIESGSFADFKNMPEKSFSFHVNIPVMLNDKKSINIPVDVAIKREADKGIFPLLIECKSAGDFTNTNKRRKEEAIKISQLKNTYGPDISFVLFLCGYFDTGYLGYEAAEGIDWIWEHRISDFYKLGI